MSSQTSTQIDSTTILPALTQILEERKQQDPEQSYVASLYASGLDKILEKVGEEATEVIIAAKNAQNDASDTAKEACVSEVADLWFHSLVMLSHLNLSADDVLAVLAQRFGVGGHTEKASRS